ncbi:MAG: dTDP-4-dehydrorhamnose 3,5-epimerase [Bacteroidales bacterium]|nr:dTDP-4-dehydrorhamnose 3,5-epimerase [Bacteroidales bacterium]
MEVIKTEIDGVLILEPQVFEDPRGYFFESFNLREFREAVGDIQFVQDNESKSRRGVIRGLHFQKGEHAQAKLVRVVKGAVLDVAVDIRPGSPTFGKYVSAVLTGENHRQFFLPRGMAHGFRVLSDEAVFQYKCDNFYCPGADAGIAWDDPEIRIDWMEPLDGVTLSEKDKRNPRLSEICQDILL